MRVSTCGLARRDRDEVVRVLCELRAREHALNGLELELGDHRRDRAFHRRPVGDTRERGLLCSYCCRPRHRADQERMTHVLRRFRQHARVGTHGELHLEVVVELLLARDDTVAGVRVHEHELVEDAGEVCVEPLARLLLCDARAVRDGHEEEELAQRLERLERAGGSSHTCREARRLEEREQRLVRLRLRAAATDERRVPRGALGVCRLQLHTPSA